MTEIPSHLVPMTSRRKQHEIITHCVEVESSVSPDLAMNRRFYAHLAQKFNVGDEVLVRPKDRSYRLLAEVVAIDLEKHWAKLRKISLVEGAMTPVLVKDEAGYRLDQDEDGWRILRGRDEVATGLATENDARAALANLKAGRKPVASKVA